MRASIRLERSERQQFDVAVALRNDGPDAIDIDIDQLLLHAGRLGLDVRDSCERQLKPIAYDVVSTTFSAPPRALGPGEALQVRISGRLLDTSPKAAALIFNSATYKLRRGDEYTLRLRWDGFVSESERFQA